MLFVVFTTVSFVAGFVAEVASGVVSGTIVDATVVGATVVGSSGVAISPVTAGRIVERLTVFSSALSAFAEML